MLCQLAVLNVRNSRLMVKDNVGSDCYWYARKRTGVCIEGITHRVNRKKIKGISQECIAQ